MFLHSVPPIRLYILCGLPCAGKSSLAAALHSRYGYTVIAIDAINTERGLGVKAAPINARQWDETYAEAYRRLDAALAGGATVIFDAARFTRGQRDHLRRLAAKCDASTCLVYLAVPVAVCHKRWLYNRRTGARFDVRDEDFENVVAHFEIPEDDERTIVYDQSQPIHEWIAYVFG